MLYNNIISTMQRMYYGSREGERVSHQGGGCGKVEKLSVNMTKRARWTSRVYDVRQEEGKAARTGRHNR